MGGFGDAYKDRVQEDFVDRWMPRDEELPPLTAETLRFNIAHRRAAEQELRDLKAALAALKEAVR